MRSDLVCWYENIGTVLNYLDDCTLMIISYRQEFGNYYDLKNKFLGETKDLLPNYHLFESLNPNYLGNEEKLSTTTSVSSLTSQTSTTSSPLSSSSEEPNFFDLNFVEDSTELGEDDPSSTFEEYIRSQSSLNTEDDDQISSNRILLLEKLKSTLALHQNNITLV